MFRLKTLTLVGMILLAAFGSASITHADLTITSGPVQSGPGNSSAAGTLNGFYLFTNGSPLASISDGLSYSGSHLGAPRGRFTATQAVLGSTGYSGSGASSPQAFLGTDGLSYTGGPAGANLQDALLSLGGFLFVPTPGTYTFSTTSKDGSLIYISGNGPFSSVAENDGLHPLATVSENVTFTQAGLYDVDLLYFNHATSGSDPAFLGASFGTGTTLYSNAALPMPEASSFVSLSLLLALGLGGLLATRLRKTSPSA